MPFENVRDFIIRTLIQDDASKGLEDIIAKAVSITQKNYVVAIEATTSQAEKAIKSIEAATNAASSIDSSKTTKGIKDQDKALGNLSDRLKDFTDQSQKAGDTIGNLFSRLDAGRLVVASSAVGMVAYAKSALQVSESARLNIDMIKDALGAEAGRALSFIQAGDKGFGTSSLTRGELGAYMRMTGYEDEDVIERTTLNAEKIMRSTFGQSLASFGIENEKQLLQTVTSEIDPTSDIGRVIASKAPELFQQGALESEKMLVMKDPKYAHMIKSSYGQAIIEQEAHKRMGVRAMETIAGPLKDDTDSYRVRMGDLADSFGSLNVAVGNAIRPAASVVIQFFTAVTRMLALAPEVPALITVILALGTAVTVLPPAFMLAAAGAKMLTASLLANPIGLAVAAIVALSIAVTALESRFGVFSKAWDHFAQSEMGKDMIAGFTELLNTIGLLGEGTDLMGGLGAGIETVTGHVARLFDMLDAVYKMAKSGDILGAARGGLELILRMSPTGMALAVAESLAPQKKVQDAILWVLQKANDMWVSFIHWLQGIYDGIKDLLSPIVKLKEIIENRLPDWAKNVLGISTKEEQPNGSVGGGFGQSQGGGGGGSGAREGALPTFEGFKEYVETARKGTDNHRSFAKFSDEVLQAAFTEAQTGVPQPHPYVDEYEYNRVVDVGYKEYLKSGESESGGSSGSKPTAAQDVYDKAKEIVEDEVKRFQENVQERDVAGLLIDALSMKNRVLGAAGGSVIDWVLGNKHAAGGEVTKSGLAWVDEGEPIVPAEVARDSNLIDLLRGASDGGGATGDITLGGITVHVNAGAGTDGYALGRQIKEVLERELSSFEFKTRVEQVIHRANRGYIG
jgi:hypothetical protein